VRRIWFLSLIAMTGFIGIAAAQLSGLRAQDTACQARIVGLVVLKVERTTVEGQSGIEVSFDKLSAERLREFTSGAIGKRITFIVNQRKLATLRLLDPLTDGNVLLTGPLDDLAVEALFARGALVDLEVE